MAWLLMCPTPPLARHYLPNPPRACPAVLYAVGSAFYVYITFLGYSALPFLERTEVG